MYTHIHNLSETRSQPASESPRAHCRGERRKDRLEREESTQMDIKASTKNYVRMYVRWKISQPCKSNSVADGLRST